MRPEPISYRTWGSEIDEASHAQMRQACTLNDLEKRGARVLSAGADEVPGVYKGIVSDCVAFTPAPECTFPVTSVTGNVATSSPSQNFHYCLLPAIKFFPSFLAGPGNKTRVS